MKKKIYVNISFDDLHPEDWWGYLWDNIMNSLLGLKGIFNNIKYTFFMTPNFCHWYNESTILKLLKRRLHLLWLKRNCLAFKKHERWENFFNILKYSEWCDFISKNIENNLFEIGIHGYNHYQKYEINSAEFLDLNSEENSKKIEDSESLLNKSKIKFTKTFRSPAWWTNKNLENDLIKHWYKYISLNPTLSDLQYNKQDKVFYIPQNYSIESACYDGVLKYLEDNNILFIKWHLYEKLENGIRKDTVLNLINLLELLKWKFNVEFIFINDVNNLYLNHKIEKVHEI